MSIHTVTLEKPNPFLKNAKGVVLTRPTEEGFDYESRVTTNTIPGTFTRRRIKFDEDLGMFPVDLDKDSLNKLVREMYLNDEDGNPITEADKRNRRDPFFNHLDLYFEIKDGRASLNEENAKDALFLSYVDHAPLFKKYKVGKKKGPRDFKAIYTVVEADSLEGKRSKDEMTESLRAAELLSKMAFERQCDILRAYGIKLENQPDPEVVKGQLFANITSHKDKRTRGTNERYIGLFLRLAEATKKELNVEGLREEARDLRVIKKKSNSGYMYGAVDLGKTLNQVSDYLNNPDNQLVLDQIKADVENIKAAK